jgi:hypothetical protein
MHKSTTLAFPRDPIAVVGAIFAFVMVAFAGFVLFRNSLKSDALEVVQVISKESANWQLATAYSLGFPKARTDDELRSYVARMEQGTLATDAGVVLSLKSNAGAPLLIDRAMRVDPETGFALLSEREQKVSRDFKSRSGTNAPFSFLHMMLFR